VGKIAVLTRKFKIFSSLFVRTCAIYNQGEEHFFSSLSCTCQKFFVPLRPERLRDEMGRVVSA
jgi:hypothetical protein